MKSLPLLLACMMIVLTSWSGMAHAAQCGNCPETVTATQSVQAKAACDGKQAPQKSDKGCLHCQAGCHSQSIGAPLAVAVPALAPSEEKSFDGVRRVALIADAIDPALRPPRA